MPKTLSQEAAIIIKKLSTFTFFQANSQNKHTPQKIKNIPEGSN